MSQPQYNSDLIFPHQNAKVEALQDSLTLQASTSGDIIINTDNNVIPTQDAHQSLGVPYLRWGWLNTTFATISGLYAQGDHIIRVSGHLFPGATLKYDLGGVATADRWNHIYGVSGNFALELVAAQIKSNIYTDSNDSGAVVTFKSPIKPNGVNTQTFGSTAFPWSHIFAASGIFNTNLTTPALSVNGLASFNGTRPRVNGSGIAMRNEIVDWEHTQVVNFGATLVTLIMEKDGLATAPYPVTYGNKMKLHPKFSITNQYISPTPDGWYLLIKKREPDNTITEVASGIFFWGASAFTHHAHVGTLQGDEADWEFEPGDGWEMWIHNDGSGTVVNTIVARATIGFVPNVPGSGTGT